MNIHIPPAALEAGARALPHAETPESMDWNYSIPAVRQEYLDKARAAFVAMVEHWPDMAHRVMPYAAIILPLPTQENDND